MCPSVKMCTYHSNGNVCTHTVTHTHTLDNNLSPNLVQNALYITPVKMAAILVESWQSGEHGAGQLAGSSFSLLFVFLTISWLCYSVTVLCSCISVVLQFKCVHFILTCTVNQLFTGNPWLLPYNVSDTMKNNVKLANSKYLIGLY